jgi:acetyltransferase-like isoleucine patch superfamily enzyme
MAEGFPGSTQKELIDAKRPLAAKYGSLFVGKKGPWALFKYEFVQMFITPVPGALGLWLRKIFYPRLMKKVGRGVVFGRNITLRHPYKIEIGDNTFIDDNAVLDAKGGSNAGIRIGTNAYLGRNTALSCKEGSIEIGDYANLSADCSLLSETSIRIGRTSFLAGGCYLVAGGNHPITDTSKPIMFQPSEAKGGIEIGEDVWLGAGVTVLDGVVIGKGSVVGAGAIVAASLPEYAYAVGGRTLRVRDRRNLQERRLPAVLPESSGRQER